MKQTGKKKSLTKTKAKGSTIEEQSQNSTNEAFSATANKKRYENTYKVDVKLRFKATEIERIASDILRQQLHDKNYDPELCKTRSQMIASKISDALKAKNYKCYKHVVVISIGSLRERPGVYLGSRCLWNDKTDSFCTVRFQNKTLYAIAMIYGLYFE